jgi:hypothetical protein
VDGPCLRRLRSMLGQSTGMLAWQTSTPRLYCCEMRCQGERRCKPPCIQGVLKSAIVTFWQKRRPFLLWHLSFVILMLIVTQVKIPVPSFYRYGAHSVRRVGIQYGSASTPNI